MREIQTEIRRDRIENDNRKTELQGKTEKGLKTAKTSSVMGQNSVQEKESNSYDGYRAVDIIAPDASGIAHQCNSDNREIQNQITHNSISSAVDQDVIHNKQDGDKIKSRSNRETPYSAAPAYLRKERAIKDFEKNYEQLKELLHSNDGLEYIGSLKHSESMSSISAQGGVSRQLQRTLAEDMKNAQKATEEYFTEIAKTENELSSLLHNNVNTYTREIFDRFSASEVEKHTEKIQELVKNISAAKENANNAVGKLNDTLKSAGREIHNKAKVASVRNAARKTVKTAVKAAGTTINLAGKLQGISSNADISDELAKQGKETSAAAINKGIDLSKKAAKKANEAIKTTREIKKVNNRALQKVQKRYIKTAHKRLVKNSATTAKNALKTAKKTAKSAKTTSQAAAKTAKTTVEATEKIISGVAKAVGSLMSSPAGPIILAVVAVIVVIVLIFNIVGGAIQAPISMISGIGSSLSWLFDFGGDEDHSGDDITDLYNAFEQKAISAMQNARAYFIGEISAIIFEDRDTLEFNGTSYYPAAAAESITQNYLNNLTYGDYPYLMQLCYVIKLSDERAAQGLGENDIPEVTVEESDILSLLKNYCYNFEIIVKDHQSCPTSDCNSVTWYHPDGYCPDVSADESCVGHLQYFCNRPHKKVIIKIQEVSKSVLENDILNLTSSEKSMLDTGVNIINSFLEP